MIHAKKERHSWPLQVGTSMPVLQRENQAPQLSHFSEEFDTMPKLEKEMPQQEKPHRCLDCGAAFSLPYGLKKHMKIHSGEKPHQCLYCSRRFRESRTLKYHVMTHTGEKPYKCSYCDKRFIQEGAWKLHIMSHTGEKPHKCSHCDRACITSANLKCHMMRQHGLEKPHKCSYCVKTFILPSLLKRHMATHSGKKMYSSKEFHPLKSKKVESAKIEEDSGHSSMVDRIPLNSSSEDRGLSNNDAIKKNMTYDEQKCNKYSPISNQSALKENSSIVHAPRNGKVLSSPVAAVKQETLYKCSICDRGFTSPGNLKTHKTIHSGEKPYKCSHCSRSFRLSSYLKMHIMTHTGERPHECSECGKGFIQRYCLKKHLKAHHKEGEMKKASLASFVLQKDEKTDIQDLHNSSKLETCDKATLQSNKVNQKVYVEKILRVPVDLPETEQTKSSPLEVETRVFNTDQKPHKCTEYCRDFHNQTDLKRHKLSQTGESPHICHYCCETFKTSATLEFHQMIHTGEKPYNCSGCNRAFRLSTTLKQHMKIHTGEKPFKCYHCSKTVRSYSTMKYDVMIHTKEKQQKCSCCDERFIQRNSLKWHLHTHHKEEEMLRCSESELSSDSEFENKDKSKASKRHADHKLANVEGRIKTAESRESISIVKMIEHPHTCFVCEEMFSSAYKLTLHLHTHMGKEVNSAKHERTPQQESRKSRNINQKVGIAKMCHEDNKNGVINEQPKSHEHIETILSSQQHRPETDKITQNVKNPCKCSVCGKVLCSIYNLTLHMRSHTGERPHVCSYCGAGFARSTNLVQHRRIHTEEKPYTCSLCKKSFRTYSTVLCHTRTHIRRKDHPPLSAQPKGQDLIEKRKSVAMPANSRPNQKNTLNLAEKVKTCPQCGEVLRDSVDLRVHVAIHKAENYTSCKVCVKGFELPEDLETHIFVCHHSFVIC